MVGPDDGIVKVHEPKTATGERDIPGRGSPRFSSLIGGRAAG